MLPWEEWASFHGRFTDWSVTADAPADTEACAHSDDGDYATVPDEAERYRDGIVTSSDQLLGAAGTNTPFEAAFVETEDGGAVAQVLGAPDLDVAWMAYELEAAPDWEASRQGEAWYRSLQAESDALLEAINAAVVFAAGLLVVSARAARLARR